MIDFILAKQNGRAISGIDRIFGINAKANEAKLLAGFGLVPGVGRLLRSPAGHAGTGSGPVCLGSR